MEKILLILNAHKPDNSSTDFACHIASLAQTKITGLLVENLYNRPHESESFHGGSYFTSVRENTYGTVTVDTDLAIRLFKDQCKKNGVEHEVLSEQGEPIQKVIVESRFADLLIVDPKISFYEGENQLPTHFVKEILANAECPVLLAPEKFEAIEEVVFCYDGSVSSVFAIKQFTHLLPVFKNKKVTLLEVNQTGGEQFTESHQRMMEWLRAHYHSACYHVLKGDVKDELFTYFFMKTKKLVVLGAYGRNLLSNFFKRSSADVLLRTVDLPLFITHV